ncbi:ABC transporter substrate-binding protein [Sinosporangium siamense]
MLLAGACDAKAGDTAGVTIACGGQEQWCSVMTSHFTKATGIPADFVRLSSGEALARIKAGRNKPEFDVWHGGPADAYVAAAAQKLLAPYRSPNAAEIKPEWKDPAGAWTGVYVGVLAFCNNTEVLAGKRMTPIRSWRELTDPRLRSNVAIAHPTTSGTGYTALWSHVELNGGAKDAALGYMRRLHPNVLQYNKTGSSAAQQAATGEVAVGIVFAHDCVAVHEEGYTNLHVSYPEEGTGYEVGGVAVVAGARNSTGARKYVDWALTAEAQELGPTARVYSLPTNPRARIGNKLRDMSKVKRVDYDIAEAGAEKIALSRRFDIEIARAPKQ